MASKYPWFPSDERRYVRDVTGTIWLIVRDGGMVTTADYSGQVFSAGIIWLKHNYGPLEYL